MKNFVVAVLFFFGGNVARRNQAKFSQKHGSCLFGVEGFGFGVLGEESRRKVFGCSRCRVQGSRFRFQGSWFRVHHGLGFMVLVFFWRGLKKEESLTSATPATHIERPA